MLFTTPSVSGPLQRQLDELDRVREQLGTSAGSASPWLGSLRRQMRATTAESSIEIEGFSVPEDEQVPLASGEETPDPSDEDRMALSCCGRAMDHVGVMAGDPVFGWGHRVILDLHFDACYFQRDRSPGLYRKGGIEVTSPDGGPPAYVGPPGDDVVPLMDDVVAWLDTGDLDSHVAVRAAMAHLHVVSVHPFRDGNGRIARILQSLVLAREGLLAPELGSIEEYLRRNTQAYYDVLRKVQGGKYQPARDASAWVRSCIQAHIEQARRRLAQIAEAGERWTQLEGLVARRRWPERLVIALEQSLINGTDRAAYATEADVSFPTASGDFRRLLDAGLVDQYGKGRSTRYMASPALRRELSTAANEGVGIAK